MDRSTDLNRRQLGRLQAVFRLAVVLLMFEVGAWIVALMTFS